LTFLDIKIILLRALSNKKNKINEDLVHPSHTRYGYHIFVCNIDLHVTIKSHNIISDMSILPKNFSINILVNT
jgi:hypothetical protein